VQTGAGMGDAAAEGAGGSGGRDGRLSDGEGVDFAEARSEQREEPARKKEEKRRRHAATGADAINSDGSNLFGSPLASKTNIATAAVAHVSSRKPSFRC